jgi:hypothetical protein
VNLAPYYELRAQLVSAVAQDLVGPDDPLNAEVISDAPITKYIAGILYPRSADPIEAEQDIDTADDDGESVVGDPPVAMANVRYPSSAGLTFTVDRSHAKTIIASARAARYVPRAPDPALPGPTSEIWQRQPVEMEPMSIDLTVDQPGKAEAIADGIDLYRRVRTVDADTVAVTVILVNTRRTQPGKPRDADSLFQVGVTVTASDPQSAVFVERPVPARDTTDEDLRAYRLLYRTARSFAIGHGCSVTWAAEPPAERATKLETDFTPTYDLGLSDSNPEIDAKALTLRFATNASRDEVISSLRGLCKGYADWIALKRADVGRLPTDLLPQADDHLSLCKEALERMRAGVDLLASTVDETPWRAFKLMNHAMLRVRARSEWLKGGRDEANPVEDDKHRWRPFQLAFILVCIGGLVDSKSSERDVADLLWFPTGGGKTEAYLGLIAFTTFLRRMRSPAHGAGVTALMRYTLRLLTIQQFERAALLICVCEAIRRERGDLGVQPISIGLWVGQGATPGTVADARAAMKKIRTGVVPADKNPMQLQACPWCGSPLVASSYRFPTSPDRLAIGCGTEGCEFKHELPVHVVDEDVYRVRPTLLVATADKFAGLPWRDDVGELFGLNHADGPPDLIIQDELHLISGPLGTLSGLFETAIDSLATRDGVRPKVIASTATIRRARGQAKGLFDREVRQFPPPGLDASDSYFAVEADRDAKGSRMYLGLMAPGTSQTTLLVRAYSALLQGAAEIPAPDSVKDPYWTLVGYFNSLRVLSGARMQVQDDVQDRMGQLANLHSTAQRQVDDVIELTSRAQAGDVPIYLRQMGLALPDKDCLDVVLATNMISVGVDVDRLGLMAVMGQPQGTSEYIQCTSRVGRKWPGLVVVLFNASRSRDRSHYESFVTYHSALYRQVEATSVTPFSSRARDRALHSVLIALARLTIPQLRRNTDAANVLNVGDALDQAANIIVDRVRRVSPDETDTTKQELDRIIQTWKAKAAETPDLVYTSFSHPETALLIEAAAESEDDSQFPTLRSLRDVDVTADLWLAR